MPDRSKTTDTLARVEPRAWLLGQARHAWGWIALAATLALAGGVLVIVQAGLLAHIIHGAFLSGLAREALLPVFLALFTVVAARAMLAWGREVAGFNAGARVRARVRLELMEHIVNLGPIYGGRQSSGALSSAAVEQVEALQGFFAHYLPQLAVVIGMPLAILAVVFPLSWAVGAILLITAPLIPLFMVLVGAGAAAVSQRQFQALARLSGYFLDTLQGFATLKVFDRSRPESETLARACDEYRQRTMGVLRIAFLSSAVLELFGSVAIALVAVYLGLSFLGYLDFGHYDRPLTLETGLFILLLAPEYYQTLRQLGTHYHARAEAVGAAGEILAVRSVPGPPRPPGAIAPQASAGIALRFEDVHVGFEGRRRAALTGFSLDVTAGERVALVGPSGAGKTTTLNLLLGLLRPDRGRILVNGLDLASLDMQAWRWRLSWVGQHPMLFYGTLRDNILVGRPDAAPEAVEQAARAAQVWEIAAELPQGLDSVVGERGIGLSGGQIQCVALARALLRDDAPLVLLDEPTASLDRERERRVLAALETLTHGRTVIVSTHRQAAARMCDRVVVLEQGRVARDACNDGDAAGRYAANPMDNPGGEAHA